MRQQRGIDHHRLLPHPIQHRQRILALPHEHDPFHHVVEPVLRDDSLTRRSTHLHGADVPHPDRHGPAARHHHVGNVLERAEQPDATHHLLLIPVRQEATARIQVGGGHRLFHLWQYDAIARKLRGIDVDLVLLDLPAEADDIRDPGYRAQCWLDDPILQRLQLRDRQRSLHCVAIDLAGRIRKRTKRG